VHFRVGRALGARCFNAATQSVNIGMTAGRIALGQSVAGGNSMSHQGRFQVHGNRSVLLDSERWEEEEPLPADKAHCSLNTLNTRVKHAHRRDCEILEQVGAFQKTHDLIDRIAENKGHGPYKWSWPKPSRKDQRRVDTEISRGWAFI
jgi:hypothetical protein